MNPNMRNEKLRGVFEGLGFSNVRSVISSGNIIFDTDESDTAKLEALIEAALPEKLSFNSITIVRSYDELKALQQKAPFEHLVHGNSSSLNVTFLKHSMPHDTTMPSDKGYTIQAAYDREVCSVIDLTTGTTPNFMAKMDKQFSKKVTTRTWLTVERIIKKMEATT